ncbi:hypothetical protein HDU78_004490 [Chytriomyces hyalinus]|nr:hypothetical protein HDU78_004490 [Chytriomyces hyalinus]KAJ3256176.1 hypothetical protein HDU77_003256 [Chytriomyces hyalinus]
MHAQEPTTSSEQSSNDDPDNIALTLLMLAADSFNGTDARKPEKRSYKAEPEDIHLDAKRVCASGSAIPGSPHMDHTYPPTQNTPNQPLDHSTHTHNAFEPLNQTSSSDAFPVQTVHLHKGNRTVSCANCHSAKRKCDRIRPSCTGCIKRSIQCEYLLDQLRVAPIIHSSVPGSGQLRLRQAAPPLAQSNIWNSPVTPLMMSPETIFSQDGSANPAAAELEKQMHAKPKKATSAAIPRVKQDTPDTLIAGPGQDPVAMILDRLAKSRHPNQPAKKLALKLLAVVDSETGNKVFHCISCRKRYFTSSGLRYHLNEEHDESDQQATFPAGYYWMDKKKASGGDVGFTCPVEGCDKRYTALSGLKYHSAHAHLELRESAKAVLDQEDEGSE